MIPQPPTLAERAVARIVDPHFAAGRVDGHRARRLIDGRDVAATDPFVLMAEDYMPRDAFARHPHRGMETVTIVLDGAIEHFDSAGHRGLIEAGDAQWMTAGRGVTHEENAVTGSVARTLQLWVNLSAADKMAEPRYQDLRGKDLPLRRERGVEIRVLSGRSGDVVSPTLNHVPVTVLDARIEPSASFRQEFAPDDNVFLLVIEGAVTVGTPPTRMATNELAWLTRDDAGAGSAVTITAGNDLTRVLLFAGRPLREPVVFGGPFVMNTEAEITQAYADHRAGRF